jgi:hypothetical protein
MMLVCVIGGFVASWLRLIGGTSLWALGADKYSGRMASCDAIGRRIYNGV